MSYWIVVAEVRTGGDGRTTWPDVDRIRNESYFSFELVHLTIIVNRTVSPRVIRQRQRAVWVFPRLALMSMIEIRPSVSRSISIVVLIGVCERGSVHIVLIEVRGRVGGIGEKARLIAWLRLIVGSIVGLWPLVFPVIAVLVPLLNRIVIILKVIVIVVVRNEGRHELARSMLLRIVILVQRRCGKPVDMCARVASLERLSHPVLVSSLHIRINESDQPCKRYLFIERLARVNSLLGSSSVGRLPGSRQAVSRHTIKQYYASARP